MDIKQQIDEKLGTIGKDRKWLAEATGYSYFSVRDCLAPDGKKLSSRMHASFLAAIAREEQQQSQPLAQSLPDRITLEVPPSTMKRWEAAAKAENETTREWAITELNRAAEAWHAMQTIKVAEDTTDYRTKSEGR